jgi:ABC-type transporter Mla subunit MlaD
VQKHPHQTLSTSLNFSVFYFFILQDPVGTINNIMRIQDLDENLSSTLGTLAKGAAKLAPTVAKTAPGAAERVAELFARHRANLAQIERLASDPRDFRAFPDVMQRLKQLHGDLYDIAHVNSSNTRVVAEVNRLRDDLQGMIRHFETNSRQPGASGMFLQSIQRELVPTLTNRLRSLEALVKANP